MPELLLELLSEEIPARMQARAADDLKRLVTKELEADGLKFESIKTFVTPRRLTLVIEGLPKKIAAKSEEKRGPRTDAPEQAIKGFMGSLPKGAKIKRRETEKGEFFFAVVEQKEQDTAQFMPFIVGASIFNLTWPKSMKWGSSDLTWVRPLSRILVIFDGKLVKGTVQLGTNYKIPGLKAGNPPEPGEKEINFSSETVGHRFLAPDSFKVTDFAYYKNKLKKAFVLVDPKDRRKKIIQAGSKLASAEGFQIPMEPALLDEVVGLAEWPILLMGSFDPEFLDLPEEVLETSMRKHQKYFAVRKPSADGKVSEIVPRFVFVANTKPSDGGKTIVAGNERVLRARLSDAKFFWDQDRKRTLESRVDDLEKRMYHEKIGTMGQKVHRLNGRIIFMAPYFPDLDKEAAKRAARLCKADLSTGMVAEFPELQGIMGCYYALADGEKPDVATAIAEHYSPQGPGDDCPSAPVSIAVALADKIDTLTGFWRVGELPTGSKDPYALRRTALGIVRLIIENKLRMPLLELFNDSMLALSRGMATTDKEREEVSKDLLSFIADRLKVHLRKKGVKHDHIDAVFLSEYHDDLVLLLDQVEALSDFLSTENGMNLLTAYRRAANILKIEEKKDGISYSEKPNPDFFVQDEEQALQNALNKDGSLALNFIEHSKFREGMAELAKLRAPVDAFFDHVTVNVEDEPALRENRLKLLSGIRSAMNAVADFSKIEGGDK
ncbi:MAG: glycine--tRNA ligase subunit beta [Rhodospirillales bacterium]|nr:glycine--tRNA ligase subunit beta [Rhodospirillales bacterium]